MSADVLREVLASAIEQARRTGRGVDLDPLDAVVLTDLDYLNAWANGEDLPRAELSKPAGPGELDVFLVIGNRAARRASLVALLAKAAGFTDTDPLTVAVGRLSETAVIEVSYEALELDPEALVDMAWRLLTTPGGPSE